MRTTASWLGRLLRAALLVLLAALGTLVMLRYAPGYFTDGGELDAQHAVAVRAALSARRSADRTALSMFEVTARGWIRGNFGNSRQFDVPVWELIRPRVAVTLSLIAHALAFGWLLALTLAIPLSAQRGRVVHVGATVASACMLAIPVGALATFFLLTNTGGPAVAVGLVVAARDFKFLMSLLRREWTNPHLLVALAQGLSIRRILRAHLLPAIAPQLIALATMSFVIALSMAVPAEVIFDVPGLGQLAWTAAMNRDAPVLLAVTILMAAAVALAGSLGSPDLQAATRTEAA